MEYFRDLTYSMTRHPFACLMPHVYFGYFEKNTHAQLHKKFYNSLLQAGFKRTIFQLVFPGQTAGLIFRIRDLYDEPNEYHIRFYKDGSIDCELEFTRWGMSHWSGARKRGIKVCENFHHIVNEMCKQLSAEEKELVLQLFTDKPYTKRCLRTYNGG